MSAYGDALQSAAQAWTVVLLTHSPRGVGQFALAWLAPRALASLLAGTIIDRHRRSTVLRISVATSALLSTALFVCALLHVLSFGILLLLSLGLSLAQPFEVNTRNSLFTSLVPHHELPAVISISFVLMYAAELLGLITGGLLLSSLGITGCVALNLVTFALYLVLVRPIRSDLLVAAGSAWTTFRDGLRFVVSRRSASVPLLVSAIFAVLGFHFDRTCLPLFAVEELDASARVYGVLLAMAPLGAVVGLSVVRSSTRALWRRVSGSIAVLALGLMLLALCTGPVWAALVLFAIGGARAVHYNTIATMLQLDVPNEMRGRVFAFYSVASGLFGVGGALMTSAAPWLGAALGWHLLWARDLNGLRAAMMAAAAVVLLAGAACVRPLRRTAVDSERMRVESV